MVLSCCESSIGGLRRGSRRRGREPQGGGYATPLLVLLRAGRGRHTMGGCGALGRQTVFHQLDMHFAGNPLTMMGSRLRRGLICGSIAGHLRGVFNVGVTQCNCVHTVDGNVMLGYEVALYSLCLTLRVRDSCCPCCRRPRAAQRPRRSRRLDRPASTYTP